MNQRTLDRGSGNGKGRSLPERATIAHGEVEAPHDDVAWMLSQMTFHERVRAYELGTLSRHELCTAAAREPELMPMLNGEFEWIALFTADLD